MAKTVRLADIGKKLNVSTVTVSKALSGQKGVSEELRAKIQQLADEMGYQKNESRKNTNENRSFTLGVIVADRYVSENQSFYWKLYQEIARQAVSRTCFALLEVISSEVEKRKELPKVILEKKADGLIIMGEFGREYAEFLLENGEIPMISLDTTGRGKSSDCVVSNNMMGGYEMTNYLFSMGHTRIGFVGKRLMTTSIDDRYFGYLKSLMEHGISWREDWVVDDRDSEGVMDIEKEFVLPKDMPSAFFCNSDLAASMLYQKLVREGYDVPADISIVGFDNYLADQFAGIGLTTYEIDTKEMAKRVVHIIIHKLLHARYSTGTFVIPGKFIERESVRRIGPPVPFAGTSQV